MNRRRSRSSTPTSSGRGRAELEATPFDQATRRTCSERPVDLADTSDCSRRSTLSVIDEPVFGQLDPRAEASRLTEIDEADLGAARGVDPDEDLPGPPERGRQEGHPSRSEPATHRARSGRAQKACRFGDAYCEAAVAGRASERDRQADMRHEVRAAAGRRRGRTCDLCAVPEALAMARKLGFTYGPDGMAKALEEIAWGLIVRPQVDPARGPAQRAGGVGNRVVEPAHAGAAACREAAGWRCGGRERGGGGADRLSQGGPGGNAIRALGRADAPEPGGRRRWWCSTPRIIRRSPSGSCPELSRCRGSTPGRR